MINAVDVPNVELFDSDLQWYALLEGAHPAFNTPGLVYRHIAAPEWVAIYKFGSYESLTKVSPILLKLDQPQEWLHYWQSEFSDLSGSILGSEKSIEPVASHLRTMVSVRVEGGPDSIFRFHDSWIASALYPSLDGPQKARFHGSVCQWLWFCGPKRYRADRPEKAVEDYALSEGWLDLSAQNQQAIHNGLVSKRNWKEGQQ